MDPPGVDGETLCTENKQRNGFMKVIIRGMDTGLYLNGPTSWGKTESEALGFENSIAALEFCVSERLHDVEILLLMGDSKVNRPQRLFPRAAAAPEIWANNRTGPAALAEAHA